MRGAEPSGPARAKFSRHDQPLMVDRGATMSARKLCGAIMSRICVRETRPHACEFVIGPDRIMGVRVLHANGVAP